jgi:hypothetical protein
MNAELKTFQYFPCSFTPVGGRKMNMCHSAKTSNRHRLSAVVLAFGLVCLPGCANYHLDMKDSDPAEKPYEAEMIHALGWGFFYKPQQITTDCNTETGINDVVVKSNYLYHLASVLTLGIWMPIEIQHRCQAGPSGEIRFDDK